MGYKKPFKINILAPATLERQRPELAWCVVQAEDPDALKFPKGARPSPRGALGERNAPPCAGIGRDQRIHDGHALGFGRNHRDRETPKS